MTYVTDQTPQQLRAHMRMLQKTPGWHNPLDDRLFKEILDQDTEIARLRTEAERYDAAVAVRDIEIEQLRDALDQLLTDMVIAQGNMRDAAKHDTRWEGCAEAIQPRVDAARAALSQEPT